MLSGHGSHLPVSTKRQEIAEIEPRFGIAYPDQKIKFLPELADFCENAVVVVFKGNKVKFIFGEVPVPLIPQIHKRFGRVQQRGAYAESRIG